MATTEPIVVRRERMIWCCVASGWTKAIAWLQMFSCVTGTLAAFVSIVGILSGNEINGGWGIVKEMIMMITHAMGAVMGYVLLKGSQLAKEEYLNMWVVYTVIAGIVHSLTYLGSGILYGGDHMYIFGSVTIIYILIAWFCILVVRHHAKEIREGIVTEATTQV